jgi:hypothetical protein
VRKRASTLMIRKRRRSSTDADRPSGSGHRVQLACLWCRSKRVRCSGTKPVCEVCVLRKMKTLRGSNTQACLKNNVTCEWPSGRRKKRTRKEMEEARRIEAQLQVGRERSTEQNVRPIKS